METRKSEWYCINQDCGVVLGNILGGEYYPSIPGKNLRTSGPNLVAVCPECGTTKTFYTADPIVRAMYQLVNAISSVAAQAMVSEVGKAMHK